MRDAELRQYAGQWVEIRLVNGDTLVGKLTTDTSVLQREAAFAIVQPSASVGEQPPRIGIADASVVESIRTVERPPQIFD